MAMSPNAAAASARCVMSSMWLFTKLPTARSTSPNQSPSRSKTPGGGGAKPVAVRTATATWSPSCLARRWSSRARPTIAAISCSQSRTRAARARTRASCAAPGAVGVPISACPVAGPNRTGGTGTASGVDALCQTAPRRARLAWASASSARADACSSSSVSSQPESRFARMSNAASVSRREFGSCLTSRTNSCAAVPCHTACTSPSRRNWSPRALTSLVTRPASRLRAPTATGSPGAGSKPRAG